MPRMRTPVLVPLSETRAYYQRLSLGTKAISVAR
jgi:hypothetical protein